MQRNIVFVATNDPAFEKTALDSITGTRHGMRKAGNAQEMWQLLTLADAADVALAIVDVDFDKRAGTLLHILCNSGPAFPVLAVAADPGALSSCEHSCGRVTCCLGKPVTEADLRMQIQELCDDNQAERCGDPLACGHCK